MMMSSFLSQELDTNVGKTIVTSCNHASFAKKRAFKSLGISQLYSGKMNRYIR